MPCVAVRVIACCARLSPQGIHVFESVGPSLGIRFAHHDALSAACGRELLVEGSTSQMPSYVHYVGRLRSVSTPRGRKPPATLPELLADIARSSHGVNDDSVRGGQPAGPEHLDARVLAQRRAGLTRLEEEAPPPPRPGADTGDKGGQ